MHDPGEATQNRQLTTLRAPEQPTLPAEALVEDRALRKLFAFMEEAELRFETLRMRILDRQTTTHGDETVTHDVALRHPGLARVVSARGDQGTDYDIWASDGLIVRTYNALGKLTTQRRAPQAPVGATDAELPEFARVYVPQTLLPPESVADTFVHPRGFCRNVLATGRVYRRGTAALAGDREAILLRCDHPRTSHVLLDRPDHWLEVGVDAQTGMILLLVEHIGDRISRHAEATSVRLDEPIQDATFTLHISSDVRTLY